MPASVYRLLYFTGGQPSRQHSNENENGRASGCPAYRLPSTVCRIFKRSFFPLTYPKQAHTKQWQIAERAPKSHFDQFPNVPPLVVQILYNRGFTMPREVTDFLNFEWAGDDPFALKDMRTAVDRLAEAILNHELITVYGDYDADGVTSTALMMQILTALGANAQPYIPNRFDEGYGLNNDALRELAQNGVKLVLTVDCGIRSVKEVEFGNSLGLDIIITDHHHVGDKIPPALAAINPKRADCTYPFKELAGVGLAFKLAQALLRTESLNGRRRQATFDPDRYLDLVALGTVADLAPLYGENRKLVEKGLRALNRSLRPGLAALLEEAGAGPNHAITAGTIGFTIGPRLNAAGRLANALAAYDLLMAENGQTAIPLAIDLNKQNRERQFLTETTVNMARDVILADKGQSPIYFISHPDFNPGVVGLAASRLTDEFYRPTLVAEQGPEFTKGSARSIAEFHITEALDQCADLLERYGGHAAAAGFTVKNENVPLLQARLREIAAQTLDVTELRPTLFVDAEVNLRAVRPALVEDIHKLQPFGYGNPTPKFVSRNLKIKQLRTVGKDNSHLRLTLNDGRQDWNAIAFRQGYWAEKLHAAQPVDVVYNLEFNEWNGSRTLQLNVKDLHLNEE
ncbi:MAG: single-stranded-DNA-specific exonuclease RecJ [Chloroflexi bacterium]|nr:MAG: single-stranded-DNA-specific exonuclease RecJ [Chloroflexota bacterium]